MGKVKNFLMEQQEQVIRDAGIMSLVIYSVELDPSKAKMERYHYNSGGKYFFTCFCSCEADLEDEVIADLCERTGCFDEEDNELPLSVAGVNEKSIRVIQVLNTMCIIDLGAL